MIDHNNLDKQIANFFDSDAFGIIGASKDRDKYGNKVVRCYMQHQKTIYPIHPKEKMIEGLSCLHSVAELPNNVNSISIITPPVITEQIVEQAIIKKIKNIWMQPGAENFKAIKSCQKHNINIIAGGPCILATLSYKDAYNL